MKTMNKKSAIYNYNHSSIILILIIFIISVIHIKCKDKETDNILTTEFSNIKKNNKDSFITKSMSMNGNVTTSLIEANSIIIKESVKVKNNTSTSSVVGSTVISNKITTEFISSKTGDVIIQGNIILVNDIESDEFTINNNSTSFAVEGVKQWVIASHDDFETQESYKGWSDKRSTTHDDDFYLNEMENIDKEYHNPNSQLLNKQITHKNTYLGGKCNFSYHEIIKEFNDLPNHSKIRITANFKFIGKWDGEIGYMKVNNKIVWSKHCEIDELLEEQVLFNKINQEDEDNIFNSALLNDEVENINVILNNKQNRVVISFGATIKNDPCIQSFGVDDITVSIK